MPNPTKRSRDRRSTAFTILELIVVVITLGVLALIAVPAFNGVINNSTAKTAEETAMGIARNAQGLAAFNTGTGTNVVSNENIDAAVAETSLDPAQGWSVDLAPATGATVGLERSGETCTITLTAVSGAVVVGDPNCTAAAGGGGTSLGIAYASTAFSLSSTSQTRSPSISGGTAQSFAYTGTLPAGMSFDTRTGTFTGPASWGIEIAQVSAGMQYTCAVTTTGGAKCWGYNGDGQLGNGSNTSTSTPTDVSGMTTGVAQISASAGAGHTCAVTTSGQVKCWGMNTQGQLGDGTTTDSNSPVAVRNSADTAPLTGVAEVHVGRLMTCARMTTGGVKCWGLNSSGGQLGDGTTSDSALPVDVLTTTGGAPLGGATALTVGDDHACVLLTSTGLKCWGGNGSGNLGDGTTTLRRTPVDVDGLTSGVAQVSASGYGTCAVTTSGAAKCWGMNTQGQLGDGTTSNAASPVNVSGLTSGVASVSMSSYFGCAVTTSGAAKCWGPNWDGELGNGTSDGSLVPVSVSGLSSATSSISAGRNHACAVKTDGALQCWGWNGVGQLGSATPVQQLAPANVPGIEPTAGFPASIQVTVTATDGSTANTTVSLTKS
jgi:alpha-tubulin suppressor-like RCC1 family protein